MPITTASDRRVVAALGATSAAIVLGLSLRYAGVAGPDDSDNLITSALLDIAGAHASSIRPVVRVLGPVGIIAWSMLLVLAGLLTRRPGLSALAVLAPLLTGTVTSSLQVIVGRTLADAPALPSGHAAGVTAMAAVTALFLRSVSGHTGTVLGVVIATITVGAMSIALVLNGFHYPTDAAAGVATAVAVVAGTSLALDAAADAFRGRAGRA